MSIELISYSDPFLVVSMRRERDNPVLYFLTFKSSSAS